MSSTTALTPPPVPSALTRWQRRIVTTDFIVLVITGFASVRGLLTMLGSGGNAIQELGGIMLLGKLIFGCTADVNLLARGRARIELIVANAVLSVLIVLFSALTLDPRAGVSSASTVYRYPGATQVIIVALSLGWNVLYLTVARRAVLAASSPTR